jgi:hypothetical protein
MQLRNNTRSALWWNCQAQAAKSIRIKLGISNFSPYFGEISQTLPCIKLSIVSPNYRLSESFSISNAQNLYAILFFIIFLILAPFFTFFPQDFSVTFLRIKPSTKGSKPLIFQALGQLVQATRWALDGRGRDRARRRQRNRW